MMGWDTGSLAQLILSFHIVTLEITHAPHLSFIVAHMSQSACPSDFATTQHPEADLYHEHSTFPRFCGSMFQYIPVLRLVWIPVTTLTMSYKNC